MVKTSVVFAIGPYFAALNMTRPPTIVSFGLTACRRRLAQPNGT